MTLLTPSNALHALRNPKRAYRYLVGPSGKHGGFKKPIGRTMTRYVLSLNAYYEMIEDVPGHIVEFGTGPGTNAALFGHLIHLHSDDVARHYYGFDTFDGYLPEDIDSDGSLSADAFAGVGVENVRAILREKGVDDVTTLIKGDLKETFPAFIDDTNHPRKGPGGLTIALLYVDCNAYTPAKVGLEAAMDYMAPGGVIAIDELRQGGETQALEEICDEYGLEFKKQTGAQTWSAYTTVD